MTTTSVFTSPAPAPAPEDPKLPIVDSGVRDGRNLSSDPGSSDSILSRKSIKASRARADRFPPYYSDYMWDSPDHLDADHLDAGPVDADHLDADQLEAIRIRFHDTDRSHTESCLNVFHVP